MLLWIRGLIFTLLVPGVVGGLVPFWLRGGAGPRGGFWNAGWLLVAVGSAVYLLCLFRFLLSGGTPAIFFTRHLGFLVGEEPRKVVREGLYRVSRNPMYVGVLLAVFGQALLFGVSPGGPVWARSGAGVPSGCGSARRAAPASGAGRGLRGILQAGAALAGVAGVAALNPASTSTCATLFYVEARNITFSLPSDLVRQAKVYAAEHDTTVNALVRELLQEKLIGEGRARAAADRLLALADRGPYFTTDPGSIRREELHERR